jgi:FliI/YscN family ATPase
MTTANGTPTVLSESLQKRLAGLQVQATAPVRAGYVTGVTGTVIRAAVPDVKVGELCRIEMGPQQQLDAEVVGFDRQDVILIPLQPLTGVAIKAPITPGGGTMTVPCGEAVRGRVLDALGRPIDGLGSLKHAEQTPMIAPPPDPLTRLRIKDPISTGVRAIDSVLTIGKGQRMGIFAAAGTGKSTLLAMIARNIQADAVVLALIGERGREVRSFIEDNLGEEGLKKSTVIVSSADQPAMLRLKAAYTAQAVAEGARRQGQNVVLMMDSVTRFARALREVGLAAGEPPGRAGYPASVFASLPLLFERAGNDDKGHITALYTVLVAGDDIEEPVADETISLIDGHIMLSRQLAARGHYPAIHVPHSVSRLMGELDLVPGHRDAAMRAKKVVSNYEENYDKISLGLYEPQSDEDQALLDSVEDVADFLKQRGDDPTPLDESVERLKDLFAGQI